jgi:biotin carboxyl carrier protein
VLNQRVLQLSQQTNGAERQLDANREQQKLIEEELQGVQELAAKGYAPKTRVLALQRSAASLTGEDGAYRAQIARGAEQIGETRLQTLSLDRQMMEEVSGQLRDVQVRLDDLQPKVLAAREQLARATVRAPSGGKVVGLNVFTVGGVVAPGQTLMEIVPQDRRLVIQAKVSPNDADDLKPGQKTQIRFTSLHERDLPLLNGTLTELSADSFTDEKTGVQYFRAEVAAPPEELDKIRKIRGGRSGLQAGLPVEVLIPLRKRSALAYLVEPMFQTFWRTGREHYLGDTILVAGGAGYIGSHTCLRLAEAGFTPVVYDNLSNGWESFVQWGPLEVGDIKDAARLDEVFAKHKPVAVIHFAAFIEVGFSVAEPGAFYANNVGGTITLIEAARRAGIDKLVFSSTCATYGAPVYVPMDEKHPQAPLNPYGRSKLMVEEILADLSRYKGFRSVALRYFNAAGADPKGGSARSTSPRPTPFRWPSPPPAASVTSSCCSARTTTPATAPACATTSTSSTWPTPMCWP